MARPTIRTGPASQYGSPNEVIREFSDGKSGGLLSIRRIDDGPLVVEVYRTDDDVEVRSGKNENTPPVPAEDALDLIAEITRGDWSADTRQEIVDVLARTGRAID